MKTRDSLHLSDSVGENSAKSTSHGGSTEEQSVAESELVSSVPERQEIDRSREQSTLCHTQEEASSKQSSSRVDSGHGHHDRAPDQHDDGNPDTGAKLFQAHVGRNLKEHISIFPIVHLSVSAKNQARARARRHNKQAHKCSKTTPSGLLCSLSLLPNEEDRQGPVVFGSGEVDVVIKSSNFGIA